MFWQSILYAQTCVQITATDFQDNPNPLLSCATQAAGQKCISLKANLPTLYRTNSYTQNSISFNGTSPYGNFNEGTPLDADVDDQFFAKVNIPFSFCYFDGVYDELVVGSNGLITFETSLLNQNSYPNFTDTSLPLKSIFAGMSDLIFSKTDDSKIYYKIVGDAPCRKFVINFYKGRLSACQESVTSQIVLHEGSNIIEVFVKDKPLSCAQSRFKESVIGLSGTDSSNPLAVYPPNRNTGIWSATNEAYRFSPSGVAISPSSISWRDANDMHLGYGQTIQVCPTKNTTYQVDVSYTLCSGSTLNLKDTISVTIDPLFPLSQNYIHNICVVGAETIHFQDFNTKVTTQDPTHFSFSYYATQSEAQAKINEITTDATVNTTTRYFVRMESIANPSCYTVSEVLINYNGAELATNIVPVCDQNNDNIEVNYNLRNFSSVLFPNGWVGSLGYYRTKEDAEAGQNVILNADVTPSSEFWVRIDRGSCVSILGPIKVNFSPGPVVNSSIDYTITTCDDLGNQIEEYDFKLIDSSITTQSGVTIKYFGSYDEAFYGSIYELKSVISGTYPIYARVENGGGCFSISKINLTVTFKSVKAKNADVFLCFNGTEDVSVDLETYAPSLLLGTQNVSYQYYKTYLDASSENPVDLANLQISKNQVITDDGSRVRKTYYVRITDKDSGCFTIRELSIYLLNPIPRTQDLEVCDVLNDGKETFMIRAFLPKLQNHSDESIQFFPDATSEANNVGEITGNYDFTATNTLYIRISTHGCKRVFPVQIKLVPTPNVLPIKEIIIANICDNNADSQEPIDLTKYQSQIYLENKPAQFYYFLGYDETTGSLSNQIYNPTTFVTGTSQRVYVQTQFVGGSSCASVTILDLKQNFLPPIYVHDATLKKCSYDSSALVSFTLSDAVSLMFEANENSLSLNQLQISYYKYYADAISGNPANALSVNYQSLNPKEEVWARFYDPVHQCYSVAKITLLTYLPPKTTLQKLLICDTNLNGRYDINLTLYYNQLVSNYNPEFTFTFFRTKAEADDINNKNGLQGIEFLELVDINETIWFRAESIPGCFSVAPINFIANKPVSLTSAGPFSLEVCDELNDGQEVINLTQFESQIVAGGQFEYFSSLADVHANTNKIMNPNSYLFHSNSGNTIYVKVSKQNLCPQLVEIKVTLKTTPIFKIDNFYICPTGEQIDVKPDFSGLNIVSYSWRDPDGNVVSTNAELLGVSKPGKYTVTVKNNLNCSYQTTFDILHKEVPVITELRAVDRTMTVIATGSKPIEYSLNGVDWQQSNVFPNLPFGNMFFYVRFVGETCIGNTMEGVIPEVFNTITPNGDGINDVWKMIGLHVFNGKPSTIKVFDRYQKLVYEGSGTNEISWNGKSNGKEIPSSSYWYVITLPDGRIFTGWILVKNRD